MFTIVFNYFILFPAVRSFGVELVLYIFLIIAKLNSIEVLLIISSIESEYGGVKEELLHGSLFVEPLLARTRVMNVLQDVTQHVPLPALVLSHAFDSLVHFSTCRPDDRCQTSSEKSYQM